MTLLLTLFVALVARATLHTETSETPKPPTLEEVQPAPIVAPQPEPQPERVDVKEVEEEVDLRVMPITGLGEQVQVRRVRGGVQLQIQDRILFEPGSAQLKPAAAQVLDRVASALADRKYPITVEGHTDDRAIASSKFPSNWELSASRAAAVVRHLSRGVDRLRMRAVGYADTMPIASNATEEGRARNRRVSIVVTTEPGVEGP
jgi:chemotaxis protein MotB